MAGRNSVLLEGFGHSASSLAKPSPSPKFQAIHFKTATQARGSLLIYVYGGELSDNSSLPEKLHVTLGFGLSKDTGAL